MTFQTKSIDFAETATVISFPTKAPSLNAIRRAPTLIRAARWRAARYRRGRDLPRLAPGLSAMRAGSEPLLLRLSEIEEECWQALKAGAAHYASERHVLALAALLAERAVARERSAGQTRRR